MTREQELRRALDLATRDTLVAHVLDECCELDFDADAGVFKGLFTDGSGRLEIGLGDPAPPFSGRALWVRLEGDGLPADLFTVTLSAAELVAGGIG